MKKPLFIKKKISFSQDFTTTYEILKKYNLSTVCKEALCPNRMECFSKKTATFLVLGDECTRNCAFCNIKYSKKPLFCNKDEPKSIALCVKDLGLKHVVITMVTRDDLEDEGSFHIAKTLSHIRTISPDTTTEVLVSDMLNNLDPVLDQKPTIFNHNIETVPRLSHIRHKATYEKSIKVLIKAKESKKSLFIKSGLMVGLGETVEEVKTAISHLHQIGCDIITIGQYMQPNKNKYKVKKYFLPSEFEELKTFGLSIGVKYLHAGPFVRSSYNAELIINKLTSN